jgi:hypothetical protein
MHLVVISNYTINSSRLEIKIHLLKLEFPRVVEELLELFGVLVDEQGDGRTLLDAADHVVATPILRHRTVAERSRHRPEEKNCTVTPWYLGGGGGDDRVQIDVPEFSSSHENDLYSGLGTVFKVNK